MIARLPLALSPLAHILGPLRPARRAMRALHMLHQFVVVNRVTILAVLPQALRLRFVA